MFKLSGFLALFVKTICATVIVISLLGGFYSLGPKLETARWPVVSKLKILKVEETPEHWTKIQVSFTKLRDCEYLGVSWYLGARTNMFERVAVVLQRDPPDVGSPNRPLGTQRAGPWLIAINEHDFYNRSFALVFHRCHPFWNTITEFYP